MLHRLKQPWLNRWSFVAWLVGEANIVTNDTVSKRDPQSKQIRTYYEVIMDMYELILGSPINTGNGKYSESPRCRFIPTKPFTQRVLFDNTVYSNASAKNKIH